MTNEDTRLNQTFDAFLQTFREPGLHEMTISPRRYCEALQIDLQILAEQVGVDRNSLVNVPGSPVIQEFLRDSVQVIRAATEVSGDVGKALSWYRHERLAVFDDRTAEQLVIEKRADAVLRYVRSIEAGSTG